MPSRKSTSTKSQKKSFGSVIFYAGVLGLPIGIGAVLGFFAADRGIRFLPTMLEILILVGAVSLLLIFWGSHWRGKVFTITPQGKKLKKRVIACLVLALLVAGGQLILFWMQTTSPLTSLSSTDFERFFEQDAQRYREYDAGLAGLVDLLEQQKEIFDTPEPKVLTPDQERLVLDAWRGIYDYSFALDRIRLFYEDWFRFDPSRVERSYHQRSFLLTFAAELSLYENSTRLVQLFAKNPNAEKFINAPHKGDELPENSFQNFRRLLQGTRDQARVLAGQQYFRWLRFVRDGRHEAQATGTSWLWNRVENQLLAVPALPDINGTGRSISSDLQIFRQSMRRVWFPMQKDISEWMGDTRIRRGSKYLITTAQLNVLDQKLEPGDILISRKDWYLSNVGLPGFWPHAFLYIGTPKKFIAYFDTPEVHAMVKKLSGKNGSLQEYLQNRWPARWRQFQNSDLEHPFVVIEAISEGVVLNNFEHAGGDYMAALRPRLDKVAKAQAIIEAFGHLNKPYDFDFDFSTDHAVWPELK